MPRISWNRRAVRIALGVFLLFGVLAGSGSPTAGEPAAAEPNGSGAGAANRVAREGVVVEFTARPVPEPSPGQAGLVEGEYADVAFRITDAVGGKPLRSLYPTAWMDIGREGKGDTDQIQGCKEKIGLFLKGVVGIRPMIDLNSYFVLVMNRDASITVIDPIVGMPKGMTNLYATVMLKRPGGDWAKSRDQKRLFVTMPRADQVAVVETETFKVAGYVDAGKSPLRAALQEDGRYLWVGNDAKEERESGVTVIDVNRQTVVGRIPTGKGHHEIAFSANDRYAYVTNRDGGTVSVIDVGQLKKIKDVKTGRLPISLSFSPLSQAFYVADGNDGVISVVDSRRHEVVARVEAKPGLGPMRITPDGRWGLVVNSIENAVYVVDTSSNKLTDTIPAGPRPYQLAVSKDFAYVRSLGTERVGAIKLSELGKGGTPPVNSFPAGAAAPEEAGEVSIAAAIAPAAGEAAILVANPVEGNIYYYMEGMIAPMGTFRNYGHVPLAVEIIDRTLKEKEPGVYSAKVRIPAAGRYDVAFLLDSPRILHCFSVSARENPLLKHEAGKFDVEYLLKDRTVRVGDTVPLRFRLIDPESRGPKAGLRDVSVLYYGMPGVQRTSVPAREVAEGIYEALLSFPRPGAYYVYVASPSAKVRFADLPYASLVAVGDQAAPKDSGAENTE